MMAFFQAGAEFLATFWTMLFHQSIFASIVFGCVWLLTRSGRLHAPRLRYGLWSLVFIRLMLPPDLSLPWSFSSLIGKAQSVFLPSQVLSADWAHFGSELTPVVAQTNAENQHLWLWWVLTGFWLMGVGYFGVRSLRSRRAFSKRVAEAQTVDDPRVCQATKRWVHLLGIQKPVRVVHADCRVSPFTIGWKKPFVFLPSALLEEEQSMWESALAHELAHVQRRDDLWIRCFHFLKTIYFFHPLVWICDRKCHHERERLCDRMVIRSGEMSPMSYGQALLAIFAKQLPAARGLPALSPAAASVASRLKSLNRYRKGSRSSLLGTLFVLCLGLLMLPMAAGGAPSSSPNKDLVWQHPLENARTTSAYGYRIHPFSKEKKFHNGIDLVASRGAWILAPADGVVLQASANYEGGENYGTVVVLQHNDTYTSFFSHLDTVAVKPGQNVKAGTRLGTVGSTGIVTAPHLHFEIWENGKPVDPYPFLREAR